MVFVVEHSVLIHSALRVTSSTKCSLTDGLNVPRVTSQYLCVFPTLKLNTLQGTAYLFQLLKNVVQKLLEPPKKKQFP